MDKDEVTYKISKELLAVVFMVTRTYLAFASFLSLVSHTTGVTLSLPCLATASRWWFNVNLRITGSLSKFIARLQRHEPAPF